MGAANGKLDDGQLIYLDPFLIERRRINLGVSVKQLAGDMIVSMNTLKAAYNGEGVRAETARRIAKQLGCQVTDLLSTEDPRYVPPASAAATASLPKL